MKVLICTGIYPPQVGGPAQYAKEVENELKNQGHKVRVLTYRLENKLPPLLRHELFFWRTFFAMPGTDFVFALDTFSVGWPATIAAKIFGKKIIIRTGGDFLWESYIERTGDLVLLKNFYSSRKEKFNAKERFVFSVTKWTLQNVSAIIFSTAWQKEIFTKAYSLNPNKNFIVENFFGKKIDSSESKGRVFVSGARNIKLKNTERLNGAFAAAKKVNSEITLDNTGAPYNEFINKIKNSYAVILASISEISPNMIIDAISLNKPFIVTRENGIYEKIKDIGVFIDPENPKDIEEKIIKMCDPVFYNEMKRKISDFNYTHSWKEITGEIITIANSI